MRSSSVDVDEVKPFENVFGNNKKANKNRLRDTIISAVELSRRTKVPMLFFSNPGFGKTTTIYNIAQRLGMHVEVVCGSQYSQDEILGFQTNEPGQTSLVIKEPEWFARINEFESRKIPSILFMDELSTVSGPTQGACLQVIFERRIRGGKALPDDCLIIAAANYKGNLSGWSEIIAPTLNRFCIINLLPEDPVEAIMEFTQDVHENQDNWPEFDNNNITDAVKNTLVSECGLIFQNLFRTYQAGSNRGFLNIRNTMYDGIYDRDDGNPEVLNFISGRTMSYLTRCLIGMTEMGLDSHSDVFKKVIGGLIGLGTNTWSEDGNIQTQTARLEKYLTDVTAKFSKILDKAVSKVNSSKSSDGDKAAINRLNELVGEDNFTNHVTAFIANQDPNKYASTDFTTLFKEACELFPSVEGMKDSLNASFQSQEEMLLFKSNMEWLAKLYDEVDYANSVTGYLKPYMLEIDKMYRTYEFYYNTACVLLNEEED